MTPKRSNARCVALASIVTAAVTSTALATDYTTEVTNLGPVAYWRLDETSGTNAADAIGSEDGTYTNGVTLGAVGFAPTGKAADFDGSNDYVLIPHDPVFHVPNGSVVFWFNPDTISGHDGIFSKDSTNYDTGGHIHIYRDGSSVKMRLQSTTVSYNVAWSGLTSGQWYHVVATFGSQGVKLYVNGAERDTDPYTGGLDTSSGGTGNFEPLVLGANTWGSGDLTHATLADYFNGRLCEVAFFDKELTSSEIATLYGAEFSFIDVTSVVGFGVQSTTDYHSGSGFHWADFDNDGDLDVFITGDSAQYAENVDEGQSFTFTSLGNLDRQATLIDYDNDGDVDVWHTLEKMYENDGVGGLTNEGAFGFTSPSNNEGVAAADVDNDGWADLIMFSQNGNHYGRHPGSIPVPPDPPMVWEEHTEDSYGLDVSGTYGNGDFCSSADVNSDGRPDFFYHYSNGQLFISDGDGTYTEDDQGISVLTGNDDKFGSAWGDYDNDGDMDLFACRLDSGQRGYLWRNDGGSFTDVTVAAGITDTSIQRGCSWGDTDNDGDLDLFIGMGDASNPSVLYVNQADGTFVVATDMPSILVDAHDVAFVDYDNDGDLDLAVTDEGSDNRLYQNQLNDTNYLEVRVLGRGNNRTNKAAIGVRVEVWNAAGDTLLGRREIGGARGYGGSNPLWLHFGGLDKDTTYKLKVYLARITYETDVVPASATTTIGATTIQQMITVDENIVDPGMTLVRWREIER